MLTYNNNPALKAKHIAHAEHHLAADMLRAGTYGAGSGKNFKACSVGCFAHDIDPETDTQHATVADHYSLPEWLIRLQDSMFEGLPANERNTFHVELAKRIPQGVSLDSVPHLIAVARIDRMLVTQRAALGLKHGYGVADAIVLVIAALESGRRAHEAAAGGNACELSAAYSAAYSAYSTADSAHSAAYSARSAADSAAHSAAYSAYSTADSAHSAAYSARSAAYSARSAAYSAHSAAYSAAHSAAWQQERDALFAALDKAGAA